MLMYSPTFSKSESPPRLKPGISEGLWEGVLLFPMDTSHFQGNGPASLASQPFWKAFIRVYSLSPCKGWRKKPGGFSLPSLHTSPWAPSVHTPGHPQGAVSGQHCCPITRNFPNPDYTHRHSLSCNTAPFPPPTAHYSPWGNSARIYSYRNLRADDAEYRQKLGPTADT